MNSIRKTVHSLGVEPFDGHHERHTQRIPIAIRIALIVWLVSLFTLLLFVFITIPQQKKVFLQNLESKALGVVVALRDVAASSAIREDFASLVSASHSLLSGDPDLDFLVINKTDGFGLFTQRSGWTFEHENDPFWQPEQRLTSATITQVLGFDVRSFHYAYPFDYSGIDWGWIHVGLSLDHYDKSVKRLYRNTFILAFFCMLLSLLVAIIYAQRVVKPLLRLREVVQKITGGDLLARAEVDRNDELGDLGVSVNIMATAIEQRDKQLQGVARAIQALIADENIHAGISNAIDIIGQATGQDRSYYYQVSHNAITDRYDAYRRFEWQKDDTQYINKSANVADLAFCRLSLGWLETLSHGSAVGGVISKMPEDIRAQFEPQGILSVLILPVILDEGLIGYIGLENSSIEYDWSENEVAILVSLAASVSSALKRFSYEQEILEAKALLENRVLERTQELQNQVVAKEKVLAELAQAQVSLMDMSRSAGMAEVATGILHNVGNVLNSVNVSCNMIMEQLRVSRTENVSRTAELLKSHEGNLVNFFSHDSKGQHIPAYLESLGDALNQERQQMQTEARSLHERIDHIKEIVAMQQTYGRVIGLLETLPPEQLMEDAIKLNVDGLDKHHIKIHREFSSVPSINTDKHKVLQILLNLINNAKQACCQVARFDRLIELKIKRVANGQLTFVVSDNGVGICHENLTRIFQHGFTTRKDGHGFGLHSGALAAKSLGGSLVAASDGPERGATFTLTLPLNPDTSQ